ncbi:MAG: hypothetical protein Q8L47_04265 [bacterium]|nr:hypothetical protein [bacterium]
MRKIIRIFIVLIAVSALAIGGYFIWQYNSPGDKPATSPSPSPKTSVLPGLSPTPIVISNNVLSLWEGPTLSGYYINNGRAITVSENGLVNSVKGQDVQSLKSAAFGEAIIKIIPSFDGKWFLEKWGNNSSPKFSLFDIENKSWIKLSDVNYMDMDFAPGESKIIYLEQVNGKINLGIIDLTKKTKDGFTRSVINSLTLRDSEITWASSDVILFKEKPAARIPSSIWKYTISSKNFEPLITGQNGLWLEWNKTVNYGIKFTNVEDGRLEVIDARGENIFTLPFITFPDKCVLNADSLYCAVPQIPPLSKELPDDYLKRAFYTNDLFYKADLKSGKLELLFGVSASPLLDVKDLKIEGNKLYFINRYDKKLYQLSL